MKYIVYLSVVLSCCLLSGCMTTGMDQETTYTVGGAAAGGAIGGIIGNNVGHGAGNKWLGMGAGALIGGLVGNLYGQRQDSIDTQLKYLQQKNSEVIVVVRNKNGSFNPITLTREPNGQWKGPKGEIYNGIPSPAVLDTMYSQ